MLNLCIDPSSAATSSLDLDKLRPTPEIARILSEREGVPVSSSTVRSWTDAGLYGVILPAKRFGGRIFASLGDVDAFLAAAELARPTAPRGGRRGRKPSAPAAESVGDSMQPGALG